MRKRRVFLILLGAVLAGELVAVFRREREPEYGGRKLSEWVMAYSRSSTLNPSRENHEAAEAIRQIGSNALPYLLNWMRYEAPLWKTKVLDFANVALPVKWHVIDQREMRLYASIRAFHALGPAASDAIPTLNEMMIGRISIEDPCFAVEALGNLGSTGLRQLQVVLTNREKWVVAPRPYIVYVLARQGTNARSALPALQFLLTDSDPIMRNGASNAIRAIDAETLEDAGRKRE